jgi:hypothetical protein
MVILDSPAPWRARSQDVGLVVVGHRQQRVRLALSIPASDSRSTVHPVAVQHDGAFQRVGGHLGARAVAFDHLDAHRAGWASSAMRHVRPTLPPPMMTMTRSCLAIGLAKDLHGARQITAFSRTHRSGPPHTS